MQIVEQATLRVISEGEEKSVEQKKIEETPATSAKCLDDKVILCVQCVVTYFATYLQNKTKFYL